MPKKDYVDPMAPGDYIPPQSSVTDDPRMPDNNSPTAPKNYIDPLAPPDTIDN